MPETKGNWVFSDGSASVCLAALTISSRVWETWVGGLGLGGSAEIRTLITFLSGFSVAIQRKQRDPFWKSRNSPYYLCVTVTKHWIKTTSGLFWLIVQGIQSTRAGRARWKEAPSTAPSQEVKHDKCWGSTCFLFFILSGTTSCGMVPPTFRWVFLPQFLTDIIRDFFL